MHPACSRGLSWPLAYTVVLCALSAMAILLDHGGDLVGGRRDLPPSRAVLHSDRPYGAVSLPFALRNGVPFVRGEVGGQTVEFLLDTGSGAVSLPYALHVPAERVGGSAWSTGAGWSGHLEHPVRVPRIRLGACDIQDALAAQADPPADSRSERLSAEDPGAVAVATPLLGGTALADVVLTVDYRARTVTFRRRDFDLRRAPRLRGAKVLRLWLYTPGGRASGLPVITGSLSGRRATFVLDTGCDGIVVSAEFYGRYLHRFPSSPARYQAAWGAGHGRAVPGVAVGAAGLSFPCTALVVDGPGFGADGILGTEFLQRFRITLDYGRSLALLEPYGGNTSPSRPRRAH